MNCLAELGNKVIKTLKDEVRTKVEDSRASAVWRMWLVDNETCNQKFKRLLLPLVHDWADLREKYDSFYIQKVKYSLKFWIVVCSVRTEKSHLAHFSTSWQQRLLRKVCLICILSKGNASFSPAQFVHSMLLKKFVRERLSQLQALYEKTKS